MDTDHNALHIRSARADAGGALGRTITCLAVPYDVLSDDLGGHKELFKPGCFSESLASPIDPRVVFNFNPEFVIGRRSAGTASFTETARGLEFWADPPRTSWANDLLVSMRRGDITQGAALYRTKLARWEYQGSQKVRVIEKAELVYACVSSFAHFAQNTATVGDSAQSSRDVKELHRMWLRGYENA